MNLSGIENDKKLNSSKEKQISSIKMKKYFFPFLSLRELVSLNDLKHQINYHNIRMQNNNFINFHTTVLKKNLKENVDFSSLKRISSEQKAKKIKFPNLKPQDKIVKVYMNPHTISYLNYKSINDKAKNNKVENIYNNYKNTSNKFNMSNLSTSGNVSFSINSKKFSNLNKLNSHSIDCSINNSYQKSNININNSNNTFVNNSYENKYQLIEFSPNNKINDFEKILNNSDNNTHKIEESVNKIFLSNLNPIYTLLKKEFLTEFKRKTKDLSILRFIYNMKKKDMEIEEERIATNQENQELNFHNLKLLIFLFNKFYDTKYEYMDYLKKTIVEDKKQNQQLYEDKITLMNDIFMIRHKTLKLENKFKNYLNDKYFLLSVKNHSFKLDKFTQEDQEDYKNDLNKLDILNFMLKVTAQECDTKENDNEKEPKKIDIKELHSKRLILFKNRNRNSIFFNENKAFKSFKKANQKVQNLRHYSLPALTDTQKQIVKTGFRAIPVYKHEEDFNRDLQQASKNIQFSLMEYNKVSRELQIMRNDLKQNILEIQNIKDFQDYMNNEIKINNKKLENLKALYNNLENYKKYLKMIKVIDLNKGKINIKLRKIINNIDNSNDELLNEYLSVTEKTTELSKLYYIEKTIEFLLKFKETQKVNNSKNFEIIENKVEKENRIRALRAKQENNLKKINSIIQKVINKNKKPIFVMRRKVDFGYNSESHKKKRPKIFNTTNYFENFDLDLI